MYNANYFILNLYELIHNLFIISEVSDGIPVPVRIIQDEKSEKLVDQLDANISVSSSSVQRRPSDPTRVHVTLPTSPRILKSTVKVKIISNIQNFTKSFVNFFFRSIDKRLTVTMNQSNQFHV